MDDQLYQRTKSIIMKPKTIKIVYWILLGLFMLVILPSSIPSALGLSYAIDHFNNHLGYPTYFLYFTGVTKLLGIVALLVPRFPKVKEWVFAGFTFDLIAAIYSSISVGDPFSGWMLILVDFVLLFFLYVFYHKKLKTSIK